MVLKKDRFIDIAPLDAMAYEEIILPSEPVTVRIVYQRLVSALKRYTHPIGKFNGQLCAVHKETSRLWPQLRIFVYVSNHNNPFTGHLSGKRHVEHAA